MSVPARLEYRQLTDNRSAPRHTLHLGSVLAESGEQVLIHDLSTTGFLIETSAAFTPGAMLQVELPERGATAAWVVWRRDQLYGCEFVSRLSDAVVSAARLRDPVPAIGTDFTGVSDKDGDTAQDRYSKRTRMLTIMGLSAALWLIIGLAALALL